MNEPLTAADRIAADFTAIPIEGHEARTLALAYFARCRELADAQARLIAGRKQAVELAEALEETARDSEAAAASCESDNAFDLAEFYRGKAEAFRQSADLAAFRAVSPGEAKHPYREDCRCSACDDFRSAIGCAG